MVYIRFQYQQLGSLSSFYSSLSLFPTSRSENTTCVSTPKRESSLIHRFLWASTNSREWHTERQQRRRKSWDNLLSWDSSSKWALELVEPASNKHFPPSIIMHFFLTVFPSLEKSMRWAFSICSILWDGKKKRADFPYAEYSTTAEHPGLFATLS